VDFSVLSLIAHNPGITSRQLCSTLGILPPNLVGMINALEKREVIARQPHPTRRPRDGPAPDRGGAKLMRDAERTAAELEAEVAARLTRRRQDADPAPQEGLRHALMPPAPLLLFV
jgi:DNA-binding MarR family transcriptional regulator